MFRQQIHIDLLVAVLEEDRIAPIASRRDVVGQTGSDDAGEAGRQGS
jgi:hypothetical protein